MRSLRRDRAGNPRLGIFLGLLAGGCLYEVPAPPETTSSGATGTPHETAAEADSYVRDGTYADDNYGDALELQVKDSSPSYTREAYLRFDLSEGPSRASAATLRLEVRHLPNGGPVELAVGSVADDDWDELSITWSAPPAGIAVNALARQTLSEPGIVAIDLTEHVDAALAAGDTRVSLRLYGDRGDDRAIDIESRERGTAKAPRLIVSPP